MRTGVYRLATLDGRNQWNHAFCVLRENGFIICFYTQPVLWIRCSFVRNPKITVAWKNSASFSLMQKSW